MMSKMVSSRSLYKSKYGLVMVIYPIGCEVMATRRKKLSFRMVLIPIGN